MLKKDYLSKATAKIAVSSEKVKVFYELADHIEQRKAKLKEIGYDDETAEEKAIEAMGDADDIAESLAALHNNFYNPAGDIIFTIIWLLLLFGGYYVDSNYFFGDPGAFSLSLATCALSVAVFFLASAITAKKKTVSKPFFLLVGGIGTGVFNYLVLSDINRLTNGSSKNIISYFKESNINFEAVPPSNKLLYWVIGTLCIIMFLFFLFSLVYGIKRRSFSNSKFDNGFNKAVVAASAVLCVVSVIAMSCLSVKFFYDRKAFREDYTASIAILQDISANCKTNEEVLDYLEKNNIEYEMESKWVCNIPRIFSTFQIEFRYNEDEEVDPFNLQNDYLYKILVSLPIDMFDNQMNSLTLSEYKTDEKTLDKITSYLPYEHNGKEKLKFYSSFVPDHCLFEYFETDFTYGQFEYNYTIGSPGYLKNYTYDIRMENDKYLKVKNKAEKIKNIIKNNIDKSPEEIARKTNTTLIKPSYSKEEWESSIDMTGTLFDRYKPLLKMKYEQLYEYKISDKWLFKLHINSDGERDAVSFYYDDSDLSTIRLALTGKAIVSFGESENLHSKIAFNGGYFDRNGRYYDNALLLRYYTKDGDCFYYYSVVNNRAENEEDFKKYYLVDDKGNVYKYDYCFIDEDGWLCFNEYGNFELQEENVYKDSSGKIYTKPFATNWDNNGKLISVERQKELIELLTTEF